MERIVILGGGYAGAMTASRLAQRGIAVTLIEAGEELVERIRLHQVAAGDEIKAVPYSRLFGSGPVRVVRAKVTAIDRSQKQVRTTGGSIHYDKLVYALGGVMDDGGVPGVRAHAVALAGLSGALKIRERLKTARRVIVVGGGLTAVELATEIAERRPGISVTMVSAEGIAPRLSDGAEQHVRAVLTRLGVRLLEQTRVVAVDAAGVILDDEERVDSDLVVWCGGFRIPSMPADSGLEVNAAGQILVDDELRSSDPDILAIGDAAAYRKLGMQCAVALPMGAYVADHLAGVTSDAFTFAYAVTCISLGRSDGVIQMKHPDDTPRERFISGRAGAWIKELVCRYALLSIRMERLGVRYRWPKAIAA